MGNPSSVEPSILLSLTAICILQQQFPYFLIIQLSVCESFPVRRMTFAINYSSSQSFRFLRGRNERSNYDVQLLNKSPGDGSNESVAFCVFTAIRIFLLSSHDGKVCEASPELTFVKWQNELHVVR